MARRSGSRSKQRLDPREALDYFYQSLLEELTKMRRMVSDLDTDRKRIELQLNQLKQQIKKLRQASDKAQEIERMDLAQQAIERASFAEQTLQSLKQSYDAATERGKQASRDAMERQNLVDSFRVHKEQFKAEYRFAITASRTNSLNISGRKIVLEQEIDGQEAVHIGSVTELLYPNSVDADEMGDED